MASINDILNTNKNEEKIKNNDIAKFTTNNSNPNLQFSNSNNNLLNSDWIKLFMENFLNVPQTSISEKSISDTSEQNNFLSTIYPPEFIQKNKNRTETFVTALNLKKTPVDKNVLIFYMMLQQQIQSLANQQNSSSNLFYLNTPEYCPKKSTQCEKNKKYNINNNYNPTIHKSTTEKNIPLQNEQYLLSSSQPNLTSNNYCNVRSRELWKKWSLEMPYNEKFVSSQKLDVLKNDEKNKISDKMTVNEFDNINNTNGFKCSRCDRMFSYAYYRDKHLKYTRCVDNGNRKFPCSFCLRSFEKRDRLRIHVLHVHENHRPHVCTTCGKAFSQSSSLNKHLRVHSGERPYQCPFCTKCFTASSILRTHIRQHSGEKPFKCSFCGKSFASHAAHDSHVRRTHSNTNVTVK